MSSLPADAAAALNALLQALTSKDNNARTQAEEMLNTDWVVQRQDMLMIGLAETLRGAEDPTVSSSILISLFLQSKLWYKHFYLKQRSISMRKKGQA